MSIPTVGSITVHEPTDEPDRDPTNLLQQAVHQTRVQAREQLVAAWQLHVERVEEQLRSGWQRHLDRLLDERFTELATALESRMQAEVETAVLRERRGATRNVTERLNHASRRLRQAGKQEDWATALLDAASAFCSRAAVFTIQGGVMRLEKASFDTDSLEVAIQEAPAFLGVVESRDPMVAVFSGSELSEPVAAALGAPDVDRVHLLPLVSQGKTVAVLYAEVPRADADPNALELIASMAAAVWEIRSAARGGSLVGIEPVKFAAVPHPQVLPAWSDLPPEDQEIHLRAQRFARVHVAEIRLYQSEAVKQGRATRSLYSVLTGEIVRGREAYRTHFVKNCPSMVDYFHVELVRTLANDDESLLGPDYPGPLV